MFLDSSFHANRRLPVGGTASEKPDFFFIQVGAFDGIESDLINPMIRRYGWSGALVEPQPSAFEALKKNYAGVPNLQFFPVAIGPDEGTLTLYSRSTGSVPIASTSKHLLVTPGHGHDEVIALDVPCWTLNHLIEEVGSPEQIDLLQVDTEGGDYKVLQSIDLNRYRPKMIRYEHALLNDRDANGCLEMLADHGYRIILEDRDTLAISITDAAVAAA
jgi:FkbM family methyltransferase